MTNECGKSASVIVAVKPTNEAGQPAAEPVKRRAETKGNADQQNTRRAQDRESVAVWQVRWAAYEKSQGKGRRNGSPRSSTISALVCSGWRFTRSSVTRRPVWMGRHGRTTRQTSSASL